MNKKEVIASLPQVYKNLYMTPEVVKKIEKIYKELYLHHTGIPGNDPTIKSLGLDIVFDPSGGKDDPVENQDNPLAEYAAKITRKLQNGNTCTLDIYPCPYSTKSVIAVCLIPDEDLIAAHAEHNDILIVYPKVYGTDHEDLGAYIYVLAKPKTGSSINFDVEQTLPYSHVLLDPHSIKIVCSESKSLTKKLQSNI